jgi:hypothetical protein
MLKIKNKKLKGDFKIMKHNAYLITLKTKEDFDNAFINMCNIVLINKKWFGLCFQVPDKLMNNIINEVDSNSIKYDKIIKHPLKW